MKIRSMVPITLYGYAMVVTEPPMVYFYSGQNGAKFVRQSDEQ